MTIEAINPSTGEVISTHDEMTAATVSRIVADGHRAFVDWRGEGFAERAAPMRRAGEILRANAAEYARLMAREMGKPVAMGSRRRRSARVAATSTPSAPPRFLDREPVATDARRSFVTFNPLGRRPRRHAVELPVLAGLPIRSARADGRQRGRPEARVQRPGLRARDRGRVPPRRFSARTCFAP